MNMVQKCRRVLWAKAHLKWSVSKWKSVLWSDESKFDILVGNHGLCVLRAKEEGDLQGSRLILPTGRSFETNFLSQSHKHMIWSQYFFALLLHHGINQCMLMNLS